MAKAMLIMDMPSGCDGCPICQGIATDGDFVCSIRDKDGNEQGYYDGEYDRPNYCPLREVPQKKVATFRDTAYDRVEKIGYNACIDELLGGGRE